MQQFLVLLPEGMPRSDVDFLIEYKGNTKSLFDLVDLKSELEDT